MDLIMTLVVIDTETTGLGHVNSPPRDDAVVQVGIAWRDKNKVKTWSEYCNPGEKFFSNGRADCALAINRISRETIESALPVKKVANELANRVEEIENTTGNSVTFKAYNRSFDEGFLRKKPWQIPSHKWGECIMRQAAGRLINGNRLKLERAMQMLRVDWPKGRAHDAATDAYAALLVHETLNKITIRNY